MYETQTTPNVVLRQIEACWYQYGCDASSPTEAKQGQPAKSVLQGLLEYKVAHCFTSVHRVGSDGAVVVGLGLRWPT